MTNTDPGNGETPGHGMNDLLRQAAGRNAFTPAEPRDTTNDAMNAHIRRAAGHPVDEPDEELAEEAEDSTDA